MHADSRHSLARPPPVCFMDLGPWNLAAGEDGEMAIGIRIYEGADLAGVIALCQQEAGRRSRPTTDGRIGR